MSGRLVGELLAARVDALAGLTQTETLVLIAIANRCLDGERTASVSWSQLDAVSGKSRSSTERAVKSLKQGGVIQVTHRGFNNAHGRASAPVYAICELPELPVSVTQVRETQPDVSVTQVRETPEPFPSNEGPFPSNGGTVSVTAMRDITVVTNGLTNDLPNGGDAREREASTHPLRADDDEPPLFCTRHPNGSEGEPCRSCGDARRIHDAWDRNRLRGVDAKVAGWDSLKGRHGSQSAKVAGWLAMGNDGPHRLRRSDQKVAHILALAHDDGGVIDGEVLDADPFQALFGEP